MTERRIVSKSARAARSLRLLGSKQALLLAACVAGGSFAVQACGSDGTPSGSGGATSNGGATPGAGTNAGGSANPGGGASGAATAGANNAGAGGSTPTAGASNAGAAGTGTAGAGGGSAGAGGSAPADPDSVLERNNHASRDGLFIQPKLTKAAIPMLTADTTFDGKFTGNMWASPLYLANGPGGKGAFFAVTTSNDVLAIDETTGKNLWTKNIGSAPQQSGAGCGSISPVGILSTPVIDATKRLIYVAGGVGTDSIARHEIHAINIDTGMEAAGWPIDLTGTKAGDVTFNTKPQNQRSALSLVNGTLYVAYGGHVGDCAVYHGWVIGVNTADPTKRGAWTTIDQGSAIWAAGGMASDGTSVFAVTGNHTPLGTHAADRASSDSEQVVRIGGLGVLDRKDQNQFFPTTWKTMDDADADFGSSNPLYLTVPGATPPNYIAALAKDGKLYLLNASNLGGMGGSVLNYTVSSGAMSVKTSPASFSDAKGTHFILTADTGAVCPSGGGGKAIVSVLIKAGSPPTATPEWCAPTGSSTAPIVTMTSATDNAAVWFINGGKLTAVDGDTGTKLYESANTCNGVRQWTSPIAVKGRIVAGGDNNLCSWSQK